jgi:hypothetical protein
MEISAAGNTVVPAILALEDLGFAISVERVAGQQVIRAVRGDETYVADDPVAVLGLVKLVEARSSQWRAADSDVERVMTQYQLGLSRAGK